MKKIILAILTLVVSVNLNAQRDVNLKVEILNPSDGYVATTMQPFYLQLKIQNIGADPLLIDDSLALYLIQNGDTVDQMGSYRVLDSITLAPQQFTVFTNQFVFYNGYEGAHISFCLYVRPFNRSSIIVDSDLSDNKDCVEMDVVAPSAGLAENEIDFVNIYPNPVQNDLHINAEGVLNVQIVDQTGKVVVDNPAQMDKIDCSKLNEGIYFALITTEKGASQKKFIVRK